MANLVPTSEESIQSLLMLEQRIPQLLTLLSQALEGLLPIPEGQEELEEGERFLMAARGYYDLLDDVQLELRTSIHHLRMSATLPLLTDFIPRASPAVAGTGAGRLSKERLVERATLEERSDALQLLLRARQAQQSTGASVSVGGQEGATSAGVERADNSEDDDAAMEEVP